MKREGLRLTPAGICLYCPAPVFAELKRSPEDNICLDCQERWPAPARELFERSGGRLPPHPAHCSEACCKGRRAA